MIIKLTGTQIGVDGNIYAAGDCLGALQTLPQRVTNLDSRTVLLSSVEIHDLTNQKSALELIFFDANPSATTFTNNAALDINDADLPRVIGHVPVLATDYVSFADNAIGSVRQIALPLAPATVGGRVYMVLVCRGAPTYTANELGVVLNIIE